MYPSIVYSNCCRIGSDVASIQPHRAIASTGSVARPLQKQQTKTRKRRTSGSKKIVSSPEQYPKSPQRAIKVQQELYVLIIDVLALFNWSCICGQLRRRQWLHWASGCESVSLAFGCVKTTLLRAVAGLEACSSGSIVLGPQPVSNRNPIPPSTPVGMVFQDYAFSTWNGPQRGVRPGASASNRAGLRVVKSGDGWAAMHHGAIHTSFGCQQQRVALSATRANQDCFCCTNLFQLEGSARATRPRSTRHP